jgi:hypothetical protein
MVHLREATLADYDQMVGLESTQNLRRRTREEWTRLWLDNPFYKELGSGWPIGWVLEDKDRRIVGTIGNLPLPYVFQGRKLTVATGRGWAVDESYRSVALMLLDQYFGQENVDIFLNTTVNSQAAEAFGVFGSTPVPAGDWTAASYWVTSYPGFARTALSLKKLPLPQLLCYPAAAALWVKDQVTAKRLPRPPRDIEVRSDIRFDARFDDFWEKLTSRRNILLGVRTREMLDWHFGASLQRGDVWLLTVPDGNQLAAYGIFQRRDEPRTGLRRIRLVDFQTVSDDAGCLDAILLKALRLARQSRIHVLEKVGRNVEDTRLIDDFAPYTRRLPAWPFFFHAPDAEFQMTLQQPEVWSPGSFDGDASL